MRLRLIFAVLCLAFGGSAQAQTIELSPSDIARAACVTIATRGGPTYQMGSGCADDRRARDCVVVRLPGNSRLVPGGPFDGPVGTREVARLGPDCGGTVPEGRAPGRSPTITDTTQPWHGDEAERIFTAEVDPGTTHDIRAVYLRQSRHYWPGADTAHYFPAEQRPNSNTWEAAPPLADGWPRADHVFYEWFIDYKSDVTGTEGTDRSASVTNPHDFVVNCTDAQTNATLMSFVPVAAAYNNNPLFNVSHPVPSHFLPWVSLQNQGMPYATPSAVAEVDSVSLGAPSLLQFRPGAAAGPSRFNNARLIGLAYGMLYSSTTRRPSLGCIPSSEWFVHEAGWHTSDGGMTTLVVDEDIKGSSTVSLLPPPGEDGILGWHPRLWDLHVWLPTSDGALPSLSIDSPVAVQGMPLSEGTFFFPETFE